MTEYGLCMPVHEPDSRFLPGWFKAIEACHKPPSFISIALDGGSEAFEGTTYAMCKLLKARKGISFDLTQLKNKPGIAAACNEAVRLNPCEWVSMFPADDRILPAYGEILEANAENADIVAMSMQPVKENGDLCGSMPDVDWLAEPFPEIYGNSPFRKIWWEKTGGFDLSTPVFDVRHWWEMRRAGARYVNAQGTPAWLFCDRDDSFSRSVLAHQKLNIRDELMRKCGL